MGIADRYTRPAASATSYRQAAEMDFKKLYDEEKQENERLRMKLGRVEREMAELKLQLEKNQKNMKSTSSSASSTGSYNNNNNAFEGVESLKDKQTLERGLAETLEELKMLENLKADNMRLKEENGALIRVISKLSKWDPCRQSIIVTVIPTCRSWSFIIVVFLHLFSSVWSR